KNQTKNQKNPHPNPLPKGEGVKNKEIKAHPPLFLAVLHEKTVIPECFYRESVEIQRDPR
ncbi:MAG: hypothetical protein V3U64_02930, partial [Cocleimonas sp.]